MSRGQILPTIFTARVREDGAAHPMARGLASVAGAVPPPLLILLSVVSIQVGAALAIKLFPALGPAGTVFLRIGFSALVLLAVSRPSLRGITLHQAVLLVAYGVLIGGMNLCFYESIARIPLGVAVTIEFTGPLVVAVATSRRPLDFLFIALAVTGLASMTPVIGRAIDPLGVVMALLAGVGWGGFILLSRRVGRAFVGAQGLALGMGVAAVGLSPLFVLGGAAGKVDPFLLAGGLAVALLATAVPFSLEFEALKRMPPRTYGVLVTLEPVAATVIGIALLGEAASLHTVAAVVCVTAGALGMALTARG